MARGDNHVFSKSFRLDDQYDVIDMYAVKEIIWGKGYDFYEKELVIDGVKFNKICIDVSDMYGKEDQEEKLSKKMDILMHLEFWGDAEGEI